MESHHKEPHNAVVDLTEKWLSESHAEQRTGINCGARENVNDQQRKAWLLPRLIFQSQARSKADQGHLRMSSEDEEHEKRDQSLNSRSLVFPSRYNKQLGTKHTFNQTVSVV